ncbi:hypothetical protein ACQHIH_21635 (plasmid) [Xanthomonas sontii]
MTQKNQTPDLINRDAARCTGDELEQSSIRDMPDLNDPHREDYDPRIEA